jgi:hypothetical protein
VKRGGIMGPIREKFMQNSKKLIPEKYNEEIKEQ